MRKTLRPFLLVWLLAGCGSPTGTGDDPLEGSLALYETAKDDAELFWDDLYRVKGLDYRPISGFTPYSVQTAVPCGETQLCHHVSDLNGMYVALSAGFVRRKELELQADCYAGAVAADGVLLGPRAGEATIRALMELVDSRDDLRWFNAAIHGTSDQRVRAFLLGLNGGNVACQEVLRFRGF
jgi:predicted metalloprotease